MSGSIEVKVPNVSQDGIATYFNRAVVSAQSFLKLKNADLQKKMEWLANGLQDAVPEILGESDAFDCAIYHFSDNLMDIAGRGSIIYFDKGKDLKSRAAIPLQKKKEGQYFEPQTRCDYMATAEKKVGRATPQTLWC